MIETNESKVKFKTIDEYISSFPPDVQKILEDLRKVIRDAAPDAQETISYGMHAFNLNGNLVFFAAFKHHIGFYPRGPSAIEAFKKELASFEVSKGTIRFPLERPIPRALVKKIVKFRVNQNMEKNKK
ncbi:MAG: iron chaperone [Candidatus Thorarchaeota archaeon]